MTLKDIWTVSQTYRIILFNLGLIVLALKEDALVVDGTCIYLRILFVSGIYAESPVLSFYEVRTAISNSFTLYCVWNSVSVL